MLPNAAPQTEIIKIIINDALAYLENNGNRLINFAILCVRKIRDMLNEAQDANHIAF